MTKEAQFAQAWANCWAEMDALKIPTVRMRRRPTASAPLPPRTVFCPAAAAATAFSASYSWVTGT